MMVRYGFDRDADDPTAGIRCGIAITFIVTKFDPPQTRVCLRRAISVATPWPHSCRCIEQNTVTFMARPRGLISHHDYSITPE
jgi:hypothetical protein